MKLDLKSVISLLILAVSTAVVGAGVVLLIYASFRFILPGQ